MRIVCECTCIVGTWICIHYDVCAHVHVCGCALIRMLLQYLVLVVGAHHL